MSQITRIGIDTSKAVFVFGRGKRALAQSW
jgi:hypothetical protein